MATNTENYNLVKPNENDYYDIGIQNDNMDKIDAELKKAQDHRENTSNPHQVTAEQTGAISSSEKGVTVATLDEDGKLEQDAKTLNGYTTDNGSNSVLLSGRKSGTEIGVNSIAEGGDTVGSGKYSHAEGYLTQATGHYSHAEGQNSVSSGYDSHAEGRENQAVGNHSHAEGDGTTANAYSSHAEGHGSTANGDSSHAEGQNTETNGTNSHAEGLACIATGYASHAEGLRTTADVYLAHTQGQYNKTLSGDADSYSAAADAFVIGNGTDPDSLSNAFRVTFSGSVYGSSSYHTSGADYSEFFEWEDGNPDKEDRVGHFVTLDGEKIKYANEGDYIVGIVSATPAVIGDHPSESWKGRWLTDVFGRIQYEEVEMPEQTEERTNPDGTTETVIVQEAHTALWPIENPDYDATKEGEYENRESRPEWSTVGLVGKLICIDDGTCEVNGYCKPKNGIATKADSGYRVIARIDDTHIKVLLK